MRHLPFNCHSLGVCNIYISRNLQFNNPLTTPSNTINTYSLSIYIFVNKLLCVSVRRPPGGFGPINCHLSLSVTLSLCLRAPVFLQNRALELSNFLLFCRTWIRDKIVPRGFSTKILNLH